MFFHFRNQSWSGLDGTGDTVLIYREKIFEYIL